MTIIAYQKKIPRESNSMASTSNFVDMDIGGTFDDSRPTASVSVSSKATTQAEGDHLIHELAAGSIAGVCEYTACQPVDVVLTRRILATTGGGGSTATSTASITSDILGLVKEGGIARVYRGLGPQVLAAVPASCGMYVGERKFGRFFDQFQSLSVSAKVGLSGFCSGLSETAAVCPFEVLKVRMQSLQHVGKYHGTFHCLRTVVKEEGLGALYSGGTPMAARNCVFNGIFFSGSHMMRERFFPTTGEETPLTNFKIDLFCGFVMGAVATPPKMPFFAVKTRLQAGGGAMALQEMGTIEIMRSIVRDEGIGALWKGTSTAMVRMSLGCAVCLSAFRGISSQFE